MTIHRRSNRLQHLGAETPVINVEDDAYEEEELGSDHDAIASDSDSHSSKLELRAAVCTTPLDSDVADVIVDACSDVGEEDGEYCEGAEEVVDRVVSCELRRDLDPATLERLEREFCIHDACELGDTVFLQLVVNLISMDGNTYLLHDLNSRDIDGATPIQVAIMYNQLACLQILLQSSFVNTSCTVAGTPLYHLVLLKASHRANLEFVQAAVALLVKYNVPCNLLDDDCRSPLHIAARFDNLASLQLIAQSPICTPLHLISQYMSCATYSTVRTALDNLLQDPTYNVVLSTKSVHGEIPTRTSDNQFLTLPSDPSPLSHHLMVLWDEETLFHITTNKPVARNSDKIPDENLYRAALLFNNSDGLLTADTVTTNTASNWFLCHSGRFANIVDILRVHEYSYVHRIITAVSNLTRVCVPEDILQQIHRVQPSISSQTQSTTDTKVLDVDTHISATSYRCALRSAGAVIEGVDAIATNRTQVAFCAIRPPGHHVGPQGAIDPDEEGSSLGFCIFNNVAIAAAYARSVHSTIFKRVAIVDFDVHHGNGTEAIVRNLVPNIHTITTTTPFGVTTYSRPCYKPWLNASDSRDVLFLSIHGKNEPNEPWFYPGSGETTAEVETYLQCGDGITVNYSGDLYKKVFHCDGVDGDTTIESYAACRLMDAVAPAAVSSTAHNPQQPQSHEMEEKDSGGCDPASKSNHQSTIQPLYDHR
uniref:Type-2 histone deacetylase 2 n=1 Tax=Lygus hesperus TaxID=30085 RepID=A0A0A9Z756_LYGHE